MSQNNVILYVVCKVCVVHSMHIQLSHLSSLIPLSFTHRKQNKEWPVPVQKLNSVWCLTDDCNPLLIPVETNWAAQYTTAEQQRSVGVQMPSAQLNIVSCYCFPLLSLIFISTFSLFIYCLEDLTPQINSWDWFGNSLLPPHHFIPFFSFPHPRSSPQNTFD